MHASGRGVTYQVVQASVLDQACTVRFLGKKVLHPQYGLGKSGKLQQRVLAPGRHAKPPLGLAAACVKLKPSHVLIDFAETNNDLFSSQCLRTWVRSLMAYKRAVTEVKSWAGQYVVPSKLAESKMDELRVLAEPASGY